MPRRCRHRKCRRALIISFRALLVYQVLVSPVTLSSPERNPRISALPVECSLRAGIPEPDLGPLVQWDV